MCPASRTTTKRSDNETTLGETALLSVVAARKPPEEFEVNVDLGLDEADDPAALAQGVARKLRCSVEHLPALEVRRRAIDARAKRVRFALLVGPRSNEKHGYPAPVEVNSNARRVVIVGGGPAGLYCAYELARRGVASTVLERGKKVQARRHDLAALQKQGELHADSNYCFGEGGAGTYSDGKLYTRAHKRGDTRDVLETLVEHGAPERILVDARPHIGSNRLPKVVTALREHLESVGVEFRYEARVTDLLLETGSPQRCVGVRLATGEELVADATVLATGHSARDIYDLLLRRAVALEAKAFALGVRIEHPQPLIDAIQYGADAKHPKLPAASYRIAHTEDGRGVFSFCMCPGGWIVPASTDAEHLVVNGMSLSRRDSPYANSGFVVGITPSDWQQAGFDALRGGIDFQAALERAAFVAGQGRMQAPATRVTDFLAGRGSSSVPASSYIPGIAPANIAETLDATDVPVATHLRRALVHFGRRMKGYVSEEAVLIGLESRTSSPLRVVRDAASLQSPSASGLFPCGEGAGYAGGIVSAALDGIAVARAIGM